MKKLILMAVCLLCFAMIITQAQAQTNPSTSQSFTQKKYIETQPDSIVIQTISMKRNTVFAEMANNGNLYSLNFDKILFSTANLKFSSTIGFGVSTAIFNGDTDPFIPLHLNIMYGKKHHIEANVGVAAAFGFEESEESWVYRVGSHSEIVQYQRPREFMTLHLGGGLAYRYQQEEGGLFVRAGFRPSFAVYSKYNQLKPEWGTHIALGYTLKQKKSTVPVLDFD